MSQKNDAPCKKAEKKARKPKDTNLHCKAYKFRLSPTKKQMGKLEWMLRRCKELYNAALQERRDAYQMNGVSVSYLMQAAQLPAIKKLREEYRDIYSQVLQDVLKRLEKGFQAFFRRIRNGETPGYPRYKSGNRYHSITYPQDGFEILHGNRLHLSKIGHIKIKLHRPMKGKIKTCTIKMASIRKNKIQTCILADSIEVGWYWCGILIYQRRQKLHSILLRRCEQSGPPPSIRSSR